MSETPGKSSIWSVCLGYYHHLAVSDFTRKVGETFATRVTLVLIGLVTSIIVARILGPEGRGLYAVALATGAIGVQLGNLGLHSSNTYYVARERSHLPQLLGNSLLVSLIIGGLGALLAWLAFNLWPQLAPVSGWQLVLALSWIPFGLAYLLFQSLLLGTQEVRTYNRIELFSKIAAVVLIGIIILREAVTVELVLLATVAAVVGSSLWSLLRLRARCGQPLSLSGNLFVRNIPYGLKAYFSSLFAFIMLKLGLLLVNYIAGAVEAGYFSIAIAMGDLIYMLPVVVGTILFPKLSAMSDQSDKWRATRKVTIIIAVVMLLCAAVAALLAGPLVALLFGDEFLPAVPAFLWLLPGVLILSVNTMFAHYFASIGMPPVTIYSPGVALLVNLALGLLLIPQLGIIGASLANGGAWTLMLAFSIHYLLTHKAETRPVAAQEGAP